MPITLGNTTITGLGVGGLPAGTVNATTLAAGAARTNFGAGAVLQVVQTVYTTTASYAGTTFQTITGLSTSITPSSTSNKILVMVNISQGEGSDAFPAYLLQRNGTTVVIADEGSQTECTFAAVRTGNDGRDQYLCEPVNYQYLDSPNTTSAVSYTVQVRPMGNVSRTVYINRGESLGDANQVRATSTMILMEIAG